MDPTADELQQINTLEEVFDWAGLDDVFREQILQGLGHPQRVREIALVPRPTWDRIVLQLQMPDLTAVAQPPLAPAHRALTAVEEAKLESVRRVCNLRVGQAADDRLGGLPQAPAIPGPPFPPVGGAVGGGPGAARRLKMSAILDPTLDAEVMPMDEGEIAQAYDMYRQRYGDFPTPDSDVSKDQLSAL